MLLVAVGLTGGCLDDATETVNRSASQETVSSVSVGGEDGAKGSTGTVYARLAEDTEDIMNLAYWQGEHIPALDASESELAYVLRHTLMFGIPTDRWGYQALSSSPPGIFSFPDNIAGDTVNIGILPIERTLFSNPDRSPYAPEYQAILEDLPSQYTAPFNQSQCQYADGRISTDVTKVPVGERTHLMAHERFHRCADDQARTRTGFSAIIQGQWRVPTHFGEHRVYLKGEQVVRVDTDSPDHNPELTPLPRRYEFSHDILAHIHDNAFMSFIGTFGYNDSWLGYQVDALVESPVVAYMMRNPGQIGGYVGGSVQFRKDNRYWFDYEPTTTGARIVRQGFQVRELQSDWIKEWSFRHSVLAQYNEHR